MSINAASTDRLRVYFSRVKPAYRELFNMAHAICGNYELAEYAVQRALLNCYLKSGRLKSRVGFRENLRGAVRSAASEQMALMEDAELTWDGFRADAIDGAQGDTVLEMATHEDVDVRRMLMLRYGCGLRAGRIARLMKKSVPQVREAIGRFERRAAKRLPPKERGRIESRIHESARRWLSSGTEGIPDPGTVYRSFEAEVMETGGPGGHISRVLAAVIAGALALLCAAIFWVTMVLLSPPQMEVPPSPAPPAFEAVAPEG